ncbi:MAG: hypothetical protein ABL907_23630, partial [Hyphomicrobium sp.]
PAEPPEAEVSVKAANAAAKTAAAPSLPPSDAQQADAQRESAVIVPLTRTVSEAAATAPEQAAIALQPHPANTAGRGPNSGNDMVDVTLARETATFSVPMNGMMMPPSLKAAMAKIHEASSRATQIAASQRSSQPAIELLEFSDDDEPVEEVKNEPLTERDLAFISRMAPPAAE